MLCYCSFIVRSCDKSQTCIFLVFSDSTATMIALTLLTALPRDHAVPSRLRVPSKFPRIPNRTKKYQSFISYALSK